MIVNYDKKNGWSSVFDGGIDSFFKGALNKNDASFVKNIKTIQNSLGTVSSKNIDRLANSIGGVNQELINSAKAVRSGKQSWSDFDNTVTKVTKSNSKFASFTSKAGSALKSFGSSVLSMGANMLAGMAIGAAISGAITLIDDYIHRNEKLIEAGEEAKSSIESTFSEFSDSKSSITDLGKSLSDNADEITSTGDAIDTLAEKYTKLRDGVSSVDNSNKFLSDEDYQSYLDISNQIAEQFPSLVSGYDAQGNAILNLGNNASTAASQLTELYNASMLSANVEIGNQLNDRYSGVEAQIKEYQNEINDWKNTIDKNNKLVASATPSVSDILGGEIEFASNAFGDQTQQVAKEINDVLSKYGLTNRRYSAPDGTIKINTTGITEDIAQEIASVYDKYSQDAVDNFAIDNAELEQKIAANKQLIQDQWNSMAESLGQYLQTNPTFTKLDSSLQNAFLGNISEIDASVIGEEYDGDVQQFLYSEIINPLSEMKPEAQQALADLVQFDPSNLKIDEYSDLVSKALYNAFPDDADMQNQMRKTFGFDKAIEEAEHQADALKNALGDGFSDAIDAMSLDELEKGYDIVINGDEAISTVDELRDKIEQTQALAATSVDLDVHTNMDAIATALESANAGADYENAVSYLEQAKELFDKGLVGTDDFKSIAAYLSPTGSDDPINFAENYGKALRYLTEDGQGVQNFLEDLQSKGLASLETLSDGTQQWKYNIDDLEDAASDMGIGFEFMMDMFGRLEDYGFHNNFVGSVEDGTSKLNDLYTQLAQEEAKLAQLQAEGANTTAIEQQQEKVNALKNDITETKDAMDQLIARSADDYAQQVDAAKQTLASLKAERDKILKDNTYGEDTQTVADLLEKQMQQIAGENGLELDANLNIKQPDSPPEIEVDTIVNKDSLDMQLSKLSSGETLKFAAEVDGDFANLEALMNQDGTVTFTANIDGVEKQVALVQNEDGTITFTADTSAVDEETSKTDGGTRITKYKPETNEIDATNAVTNGGNRTVNYSANTSNLPTSFAPITRTVRYVAQGATSSISSALSAAKSYVDSHYDTGTMLSPAHASGTAYNMLNLKPAYADGKVTLSQNEEALVNELGMESRIRDGVWSLIPGGMHIESLKKGDIILNANQTKALLQYGKANGHARAYASGSLLSAYANGSGGGSFFIGGSGSSSGMSGRPSSSSTSSSSKSSSSTKSAQKAADTAKEAADEFEEAFDEIEILLDRMDRTLQQLTDSIETYSYDLSKQSSVADQAMNTIRTDLNTLQQAYNRYMKEAENVDLSDSWKRIVQNGKIDITTITDENLADQIKKYQEYFEKALDVQDTIADYQSQLLDLATEKFDNIEQYFENRTNYNDEFGYLTDISTLQDAVNKLTAELDKQVLAGVIKEGSNEWYEAMSKISEAQDALTEATLKKYQDIIDNLDRISTTLDNSLELKEARGDKITEEDYQRPLEVANEQIDELYKKREQLLKQQGIYDVGSAKYDDYAEQIADIDDEIYGLLGDIEDLKDSIWEVRWQPFFDGMEAAENLRKEMDDIRGLLDDEAFIGSDAGLTSDGLANLALISSAMNVEKQRIRDYQEAISKLNEDLDAGNISTSEYEEQLDSFLSEIRSGVSAVNDYEDEILSLHEKMLQAENDIIQNSIEKYQKLNNERQKSDSYARNIRNQTKEINQIEAQLSALSGVTNESALRQKKLLEAQLAELQDELDQTQQDHAYDVRDQGYQNLSDSLNEQLNDTLDNIKYNSSEQERVISEMLDHIVNNYADAYDKINQIISDTGLVPSDGFQQIIDNIGNQQGAQDQVNDSNTNAPDYDPSDFTNINTGGIQSGSNQANNDKIQDAIEKEPNTDNRPVAQITLKPTSLSLQEGKSSTIKANIRPTDAANKSVKWSSSNTKVATVSNGVVKAVKAGSAKITCTAQDGSGISASCSVTVTAKPKPTKPSGSTSGGDGKPRVGDRVTLSGWYYYDSYGKSPAGNRYSGVKNGVVIDAYSAKKYGGNGNRTGSYDVHIKSADGKYGDLGWVKLSQLSGYATGTKGITNPVEIARVDELGKELRIKRGGDIYEMFRYGDAVVPKNMTDNLFTLADHTNEVMETINNADRSGGDVTVNNNYDSLVHVDGNVDKEALPGLEEIVKRACAYTTKEFKKDARYMGITRTL